VSLRTIDLSRGPDAVGPALDEICRDVGFVRVGGHGIDVDLRRAVMGACAALFALPDDLKRSATSTALNRGYAPIAEEHLGTTLDDDRVERSGAVPDLYESFTTGDPTSEDVTWPVQPTDFARLWQAWWAEMSRVGTALLECCAVALGLPASWFEPSFRRPLTVMRAIHYPPTTSPGGPGQMRAGAHTDYGTMTVLQTDDVPGLEVHRDGRWEPVEPIPDLLVVNVGDLLARWTNDRWRSTLHRVVPVPDADGPGLLGRQSIAWFQQPDHDAVVACLPTCTSADDPPRYAPTTSGRHYDDKIARQYATPPERASSRQ